MYYFKKEKYSDLLNGKTVEWLASKVEYTATSLYLLFNDHNGCKKPLAYMIVSILTGNSNMDNIDEYFYKKGD